LNQKGDRKMLLKKIKLLILLIAGIVMLSACGGTKSGYQNVSDNKVASNFSPMDQKLLIEQLAEKIKNDPQLKAEVGNDRPALLIDVVKNKTSEHIDTEAITDTLKININKSMLFSIISRERNDLLLNEQKLAQSGLSDKDKVAQLGKLFGAKYVLYGSFSSITNMVNSQKQTYYKLNLSILNIETGQEVFIDEAELNKISKKSMF
jgi:uncharacterized protein (TIGR02722 family)